MKKGALVKIYLLILFLIILCRPYVIKLFECIDNSYTIALGVLVLLTVIILFIMYKRKQILKINKKLLFISLLVILPSLYNNAYLHDARYGIYLYYLFSIFIGVLLSLINLEEQHIKFIFKILFVFSLLTCVVSWISYYNKDVYLNVFLKLLPLEQQLEISKDFRLYNAIPGLTDHYSRNAFYIILGLISCFYNYKELKCNKKYIYVLSGVFLFFTLLMIGKRGPFLFLIISVILTYILTNKLSKKLIKNVLISFSSFIIVIILAFVLIPSTSKIISRFSSLSDISNGRFDFYSKVTNLYVKNHYKPIGWGQFSKNTNYVAAGVHNDYMQIFFETGIIGTIFIIGTNIYFLIYSIKVTKKRKNAFYLIVVFYNFFYLLYSMTGLPHYDFETNSMFYIFNALLFLMNDGTIKIKNNRKVGIITLNGYFNYGNRLQNYALTKSIEKYGFEVYTLWNKNIKLVLKNIIKLCLSFLKKYKRFLHFYKFSKNNMNESLMFNVNENDYDYIVIGSDQVWNYKEVNVDNKLLGLDDVNIDTFSYSASFGLNNVDEKLIDLYRKQLLKLKSISVREEIGVELVKEITGRKDAKVLIDPTMLLSAKEWSKISKKPEGFKEKKYILNYFLGNVSSTNKKQILEFAKKHNCSIINLTDISDKYYTSGPEEFLYLEKNAYMVCTDSFHASVFAFLFDKPFVVFDRDDNLIGNMSSRLDTLLDIFEIKNRKYNGKSITSSNLRHNYELSYKILEKEIKKSEKYLKDNLMK